MHYSYVLAAAPALLSLFTTGVSGLGINCRGSFQCVFLTDNPADQVVSQISGIDQNRFFRDGELISCAGFICAFLQNTPGGGLFGRDVLKLAPMILQHGCDQCGSVPIDFPQSNDVARGQLTINAVGGCNPCKNGNGLCPPNTGGNDGGAGPICIT